VKRDDESWIAYALRIDCQHPHFLSFAKKCKSCRKTSLSPLGK